MHPIPVPVAAGGIPVSPPSFHSIVPSRQSLINSKWSLDPDVFTNLCHEFQVSPTIDWFAWGANTKCKECVSLYWEPDSKAVDALLHDWHEEINDLFPPIHFTHQGTQENQDRTNQGNNNSPNLDRCHQYIGFGRYRFHSTHHLNTFYP
jgi:hypothetical protein